MVNPNDRLTIELTPEQLAALAPFEDAVQHQANIGEPIALMAQVEPIYGRVRLVVIDADTAKKIQDVMEAGGYLPSDQRLESELYLQHRADLYAIGAGETVTA